MANNPKYEIWVTTYEVSDDEYTPTLSHVFYGKTLDEAYGYAKSHLISDYFFCSSFVGQMIWGDTILTLTNDYRILDIDKPQSPIDTGYLSTKLKQEAFKVSKTQHKHGLVMVIQQIVKERK